MSEKNLLNKVRELLGMEVKLEQRKLEDGVTIIEADEFLTCSQIRDPSPRRSQQAARAALGRPRLQGQGTRSRARDRRCARRRRSSRYSRTISCIPLHLRPFKMKFLMILKKPLKKGEGEGKKTGEEIKNKNYSISIKYPKSCWNDPNHCKTRTCAEEPFEEFRDFFFLLFYWAEIFCISNLNYAHIMAVRVVEFSDDGYKINKMFS